MRGSFPLYLGLLVLILSGFLFWVSARQRKKTALPGGKVIYADTQKWGEVTDPLYDSNLDLTGKPDYLVQHGREIIPVEVKSSRISVSPYDSHIFQLAVYCYLVERTYGYRPPYGIIKYANKTFRIDYTDSLESSLLDVLADMRRYAGRTSVNREHTDSARCAGCGYREKCNQALV